MPYRQASSPPPKPHAPPGLFIRKLHTLRDELFTRPQPGNSFENKELRAWIDHCDTNHANHYQFSARSEQIFTYRPKWLIDVQRLCLVATEPTHRYIAIELRLESAQWS